jgi:hypothetical protein
MYVWSVADAASGSNVAPPSHETDIDPVTVVLGRSPSDIAAVTVRSVVEYTGCEQVRAGGTTVSAWAGTTVIANATRAAIAITITR